MKRIYLLRHAKSSWEHRGLADEDRPLAARGRKAAELIGTFLAEEALFPDRVLCSTARRALETWERLRPFLPPKIAVELREELYLASAEQILAVVQALPPAEESALLIGHNPGIETAMHLLAGTGDPEALRELARKVPTGALAVLDLPVSRWQEVRPGHGILVDFVRPRSLRRPPHR